MGVGTVELSALLEWVCAGQKKWLMITIMIAMVAGYGNVIIGFTWLLQCKAADLSQCDF